MGYLVYLYVKAKSFKVLSKDGNGGFRFAERCKGVYRALILGKPSVVWLLNMAEDYIRGENLREFYRTLRVGSTAHIVQTRANSHERFLEVSEYRTGGRQSFIIIPEGREGSGPGNCVVQMRKAVIYIEQQGVIGSRFGKAYGANPSMHWIVDKGRWFYVDALVRKIYFLGNSLRARVIWVIRGF